MLEERIQAAQAMILEEKKEKYEKGSGLLSNHSLSRCNVLMARPLRIEYAGALYHVTYQQIGKEFGRPFHYSWPDRASAFK